MFLLRFSMWTHVGGMFSRRRIVILLPFFLCTSVGGMFARRTEISLGIENIKTEQKHDHKVCKTSSVVMYVTIREQTTLPMNIELSIIENSYSCETSPTIQLEMKTIWPPP